MKGKGRGRGEMEQIKLDNNFLFVYPLFVVYLLFSVEADPRGGSASQRAKVVGQLGGVVLVAAGRRLMDCSRATCCRTGQQ